MGSSRPYWAVVLVESIARRQSLDVREAYTSYAGPLYRFALAYSGSEARAAEAVQEVFLELLRKPALYDPARGALSSLLFGMVRNRLRTARRSEEREDALDENEATEEDLLAGLEQAQRVAAVRAAILALPEHYREVVLLCEIEECSYEEAAAALGLPVGTVRSRLSRARGQLRQRLKETGEVL